MKRRRDDSIKPGVGIDGDLGRSLTRRNRTSPWSYGEKDQSKYDLNDSAMNDSNMPGEDGNRDIQFMWGSRQIWSDVEANSDTVDAKHNAITHGVNRSQYERD